MSAQVEATMKWDSNGQPYVTVPCCPATLGGYQCARPKNHRGDHNVHAGRQGHAATYVWGPSISRRAAAS